MVARLAAKAVTKFLKKRATPKAKPKAADKARKEAGRKAADLGTPASEARKPGRAYGKEIHEPSPTDVEIARGERLSTMKGVQKRYNDNKKKLEELKRDLEFLKLKASPGKNKTVMGRHKANQKLKNVKEEIKHLKTSMTDMVKRHNIKKKSGGKVIQKKHGGMTHVGLSPAEEARAGTMPKDKRVKYMAKGSQIKKKKPQSTAAKREAAERKRDKERQRQAEFPKWALQRAFEDKQKEENRRRNIYSRKGTLVTPRKRKPKPKPKPLTKEEKAWDLKQIRARDPSAHSWTERAQHPTTRESQADARLLAHEAAMDKKLSEMGREGYIEEQTDRYGSSARPHAIKDWKEREARSDHWLRGGQSEGWHTDNRAKGGKVGNKKSRGKRISNKETDGSKLVASLYD